MQGNRLRLVLSNTDDKQLDSLGTDVARMSTLRLVKGKLETTWKIPHGSDGSLDLER